MTRSSRRLGRLLLALTAAPLLFTACAQTRVVDEWRTGEAVTHTPEKVAVVAVLPDALMRKAVERDVARILVDGGTPAVAASTVPGMSGGIRGEIDSEAGAALLREAGVDGVVVLFYSGGGLSEGYVRSDYWAEYLGSGVAYDWGYPYFTGFTDVYTVRKGPGYADVRQTAYVESSFYDLESRQPVWRVVTYTKDTEHTDTVRDIAKRISSEMRRAGLN